MVVCERKRHCLIRFYFSVNYLYSGGDRVYAEDARLRRIDDRRKGFYTEGTEVGDREGSALHLVGSERARLSGLCKLFCFFGDLGKSLLVRVHDSRNEKSLFGINGNTQMNAAEFTQNVAFKQMSVQICVFGFREYS